MVIRREFVPTRNGAAFSGYSVEMRQSRCRTTRGRLELPTGGGDWCAFSLIDAKDAYYSLSSRCPELHSIGWFKPDVCREGTLLVRGNDPSISLGKLSGARSWMSLMITILFKNLVGVGAVLLGTLFLAGMAYLTLATIYRQPSVSA